jgi:hypothetical protein
LFQLGRVIGKNYQLGKIYQLTQLVPAFDKYGNIWYNKRKGRDRGWVRGRG